MAASDELPRGWLFQGTFSSGQTPGLTIPAINGVSHVVTQIDWIVYVGVTTATAGYNAFMNLTSGGTVSLSLLVSDISTTPFTKDTMSEQLKVVCPIAASTVLTAGGPISTGMGSLLVVQGYDI